LKSQTKVRHRLYFSSWSGQRITVRVNVIGPSQLELSFQRGHARIAVLVSHDGLGGLVAALRSRCAAAWAELAALGEDEPDDSRALWAADRLPHSDERLQSVPESFDVSAAGTTYDLSCSEGSTQAMRLHFTAPGPESRTGLDVTFFLNAGDVEQLVADLQIALAPGSSARVPRPATALHGARS
jgi:hypothetical protein